MLEGGGQILRNAAALAAVIGRPVRVCSIRAGRDRPGLRPQHLAGLQMIEALSGGELLGGFVGSSCVALLPGALRCADRLVDTGTAGSCVLLAQAALPCLLLARPGPGGCSESHLELRGGTDAAMAPPADYLSHVLLPVLRSQLGVHAEMGLQRRGFYPKVCRCGMTPSQKQKRLPCPAAPAFLSPAPAALPPRRPQPARGSC